MTYFELQATLDFTCAEKTIVVSLPDFSFYTLYLLWTGKNGLLNIHLILYSTGAEHCGLTFLRLHSLVFNSSQSWNDATTILIPHDILCILFTWINTLFIAQDNTAIRQVHLKIELNTNVNIASYAVWLLQNALCWIDHTCFHRKQKVNCLISCPY